MISCILCTILESLFLCASVVKLVDTSDQRVFNKGSALSAMVGEKLGELSGKLKTYVHANQQPSRQRRKVQRLPEL